MQKKDWDKNCYGLIFYGRVQAKVVLSISSWTCAKSAKLKSENGKENLAAECVFMKTQCQDQRWKQNRKLCGKCYNPKDNIVKNISIEETK